MFTILYVLILFILIWIVIAISNSKEKSKWLEDRKQDPALAYFNRARDKYDEPVGDINDRFQNAIDDLTLAISIDPIYADAYLSRGTLYSDHGFKEKAIADLKRFLELSDLHNDDQILEAFQRHTNPTREPSAVLLSIAKASNKSSRELANKILRNLEPSSDKKRTRKRSGT